MPERTINTKTKWGLILTEVALIAGGVGCSKIITPTQTDLDNSENQPKSGETVGTPPTETLKTSITKTLEPTPTTTPVPTEIPTLTDTVAETATPTDEIEDFYYWDLPEVIDNRNSPLPESIDSCPTINDLDTLMKMEDELLSLRPEVKEIITRTPIYDILDWGGGKALNTHDAAFPISCTKLDLGDRGYTYLVGLLVKNTDDSHGILHTQFGGEIDGEVVSEWIGFQSSENPHFYDRPVRASTEEVFDIMKSMRMQGVALALEVVNSSDFYWVESTSFSEELLNQQPDVLQIIADIRQTSGKSFKGVVGPTQREIILPLSTIFAIPEEK